MNTVKSTKNCLSRFLHRSFINSVSLIGTLQSAQTFPCPEAYLKPSRTSAMEPLCENSELAVNYFRKKASS